MNISEIERVVKSFQGTIFRRSSNVSAGILKSKIRGSGLQFRDHQIYSHGDDVRFIDWKVSARATNIHIKTFEEDRNSQINVILDLNPTMLYGSDGVTKLQAALELCAMLYLLTQKTNDQIHLKLIINDQVHMFQPLKGQLAIAALIKQLEKVKIYTESGQLNLKIQRKLAFNSFEKVENEIRKSISKRKEVIFLSDRNLSEKTAQELRKNSYYHPIKVLSPIDVKPLLFSINSGVIKGTGLSYSSTSDDNVPIVKTDEKYLELFLRRLR